MANGILASQATMSSQPATFADIDEPASQAAQSAQQPAVGDLNTMLNTPTQQATTYTPQPESLVSSQLERLLAKDNPYVSRARTRAAEVANQRGLLNSSIAAGAGEAAAIDAALPIAQADAGTWGAAQRYNTDATNTFSRDANAFTRQGLLQQQAQAWQSGERLGTQQFTTGRDATQFANRLAEIRALGDEQMRQWDAQNGTRLYDDYQATSQQTYDSYLNAVQQIQVSDMDPDVKQAQIASLQQMFTQRQEFINVMYEAMPRWSEEWAQFDLDLGGGE